MTNPPSNTCPYGIVNIYAVAECLILLLASPTPFHQSLASWLQDNYCLLHTLGMELDKAEPLGRCIITVSDLSVLVCAYSNARMLKHKKSKRGLMHELYFYGHGPDRDSGVEAGRMSQALQQNGIVPVVASEHGKRSPG